MTTTAIARQAAGRTNDTQKRKTASSQPPPHLDASQARLLESELRSELRMLERRLAAERADASAGSSLEAGLDLAASSARMSDALARHEVVADALARLASGTYGICSRCADPIAFDRLFAIPDTTHCLGCSGRA